MKKTVYCLGGVLMFMKKALAVVSVILLALAPFFPLDTVPSSAFASANEQKSAADGYNANDYNKLACFLELKDEKGIKNGQKLSVSYDPAKPETWFEPFEDKQGSIELPSVIWREIGGEMRLVRLDLPFMREFRGRLDLSGCSALEYLCFRDNLITELDISGCTALTSIICYRNKLTSLDVSDCHKLSTLAFQDNSVALIDVSNNPALSALCCDGNGIESLELSHNPELTELRCENNRISSLDLSNNPKLNWLWTDGNPLNELDLSSNPLLYMDRICAVGGGTVSYSGNEYSNTVTATTIGELEFAGWYDNDGDAITYDAEYVISQGTPTELTARFGVSMRGSSGLYNWIHRRDEDANYLIPVLIGVTVVLLAIGGTIAYRRLRRK